MWVGLRSPLNWPQAKTPAEKEDAVRQEIVKAYGNIHPAGPELLAAVAAALDFWNLGNCAELEGDLLRIACEGVFFPLDDVLEAVRPLLKEESRGKIDVIDTEAWTLTRCAIQGRDIVRSARGLNDVLAYSGW